MDRLFYSKRVNTPRLASFVNVIKFENVFLQNAPWACPGENLLLVFPHKEVIEGIFPGSCKKQ